MKKFFALMMAALMMMSMLAACGGNTGPEDPKTIRIGLTGPLSGNNAVYGKAVEAGMKIAVEEVNAKGGLQFEFKAEDDVSDNEIAGNAYNSLKDWEMDIFAGAVTSGPCNVIAPLAVEDQIFMMTPSGSNEDIVKAGDSVFQMCYTDPNQGAASAELIKAKMPDAVIGVIYDSSTDYSTGVYKSFMNKAKELNLNVVEDAINSFDANSSSEMNTQLTACKNAGCTLVFIPIYAAEASTILNNANTMGYDVTFLGCDGMDGILTLEGFNKDLAEGLIMMTPFAADAPDAATQSFVAKYKAMMNGEVPNQFAADGYDVIMALYQACTELGIDGTMSKEDMCAKLTAYFTSNSFNGLTGTNMIWETSGIVSKVPNAVVVENGVYVSMAG